MAKKRKYSKVPVKFNAQNALASLDTQWKRYENRQAIILTSNKAFADWSKVFADDPIMASAALDRLLHRSTFINIRGQAIGALINSRQAPRQPPLRSKSPHPVGTSYVSISFSSATR
jgi:hypothetical protein